VHSQEHHWRAAVKAWETGTLAGLEQGLLHCNSRDVWWWCCIVAPAVGAEAEIRLDDDSEAAVAVAD
jgi:hypothetical protein